MAVKCNLVSFTSNLCERHDPYSWIKIQVVLGKTEEKGGGGEGVPKCPTVVLSPQDGWWVVR